MRTERGSRDHGIGKGKPGGKRADVAARGNASGENRFGKSQPRNVEQTRVRKRRFAPADGGNGTGTGSNQGRSHGGRDFGSRTAQAHHNRGIGAGAGGAAGAGAGAGAGGGAGKAVASADRFEGYGGDALAKRGGLGTNDFIDTVKQDGPAFLQSPGDGQLMVVPEQGARALDSASMNAAMAKAQLTGKPVNTAMAEALSAQGYTVYTREFGDYMGPFLQAAEAAASTA